MANTSSTDLERSSSQFWSIASASAVNLSIIGDISIGFWIKLESLPSVSGGDYGFVDKMKWSASRLGYSVNSDNTDNIQVFFYSATSTLSRYSVSSFWDAGDIGVWRHVGLSWTAASPSTMLIYKDGVSKTVSTASSSATSTGVNLFDFTIGRYNGANSMDGLVNDVRIWSRALTGTELTNLATSPCSFSNGSNLQGWWFHNGANSNDESGNGYTLTAGGGAGFVSDSPYTCSVSTIKTWDGIARANLKTLDGVASASIKTINGIA